MRDLKVLSDAELKVHALTSLGFGALPIENWACFFEPSIAVHPGDIALANRAFSIWVPTMTDFIGAEAHMAAVKADAQRRSLKCGQVFTLAEELGRRMRSVLRLLTREDQIFLRDRRLQNVHGSLEYFLAETPSVKWYDPATDTVVVEQIPEAELHYKLLHPYNKQIGQSQATLRERVVGSGEWASLFDLYRTSLTRQHLERIMEGLGVGA